MLTKKISKIVLVGFVLSLFCAGSSIAGQVLLKADSYSLVKDAGDRLPSAFTLMFDLSGIPADVRIDLAELTVKADIDAKKVDIVNVLAHAALAEWTPSTTLGSESISTTDSLFANGFMTMGDSLVVRINLTEIVTRWHDGSLANHGLVISLAEYENIKSVCPVEEAGEIRVELSVFYSK